jgi:hypothetical protein
MCISLPMQNPNHTLYTPHTYIKFLTNNNDILSLRASIHFKLYDYITHSNPPANFETTKATFSFLPDILITEALKCTQPLIGYIPPPQHNKPPPPKN